MSAGHAARLGVRMRFRARLNNFDAIGQMVAAGIGIGVMPEVAAKRCARSMKISVVRIRRFLGQPAAGDLRAQFQGAAKAGAATGGAFAQIGAQRSVQKCGRRLDCRMNIDAGGNAAPLHLHLCQRPAALITFAHFWVSLAMKSRNCSGVSPATVRP